jgi:hypothetical protein
MANGGEAAKDPKVVGLLKLYEQSFWLYTVILALAIREVLLQILPRVFNHYFAAGLKEPSPPSPGAFYFELLRSLVFLIMVTRFFLGGVLVFTELTQKAIDPPDGSWMHVLTGFVHYSLFFGWALTAFVQSTGVPSLFMGVLTVILLWDVFWFWLSPEAHRPMIKPWMWRNLRTVIYIVVLLFVAHCWLGPLPSEAIALVPVLVISVKELHEMFTKRPPPETFWAFL